MDPSRIELAAWMRERQQRIEGVLDALLPPPEVLPARLHEAMRYAVLGGGKRVRPLLAFAAAEVSQAPLDRADRAAAAVELIHAYSLVHDDLPCMDDDVLRRGRPTCHIAFDEATAMLVGDALQSLAFQALSDGDVADDPRAQIEMVRVLSRAAGSRGMAGGQAIDLASTGRELSLPELENMHIHKTGALIRAAILLGAHCGNALAQREVEHLDHFAKCAGLAFQVLDDVLDAESDTDTLGKTAGKDAAQSKATYVSTLGLVRAREFAGELHEEALEALSGFGARAHRLRQLIGFIVLRTH